MEFRVTDDHHKYNSGFKFEGCYPTFVSNGNDIFQSENVLAFYLPNFAAQVAFILFTSRCLYYLLRPFNQPRFVIEILIGFILSPELLGGTRFFTKLMPLKSVITTETISYVGLVYYVFLAGLDMNYDTIQKASKKANIIALAVTSLPMIMGAGIYTLLLNSYKESPESPGYVAQFNTNAAYAFWALIFSVTGFPIVTQILADLKLLYTGLGKVALTTAVITDFCNWIFFAVNIPSALNETTPQISILSTALFITFSFYVVRPYLVKLINRKTNLNDWDNEHMFFVVMGAYISAAITDHLGTHPVVGALVYGIMIPRGRFTEMLIEKSEDFGAVYLAPLFVTTCSIRLRIIYAITTQGWLLVGGFVLLSCIPKVLSTLIAVQFYGMPALDGLAIGFIMNTKGILPLIMLNIAWDKKILSQESFSIMMASIFVMTLTVPLIINAIYKPRKLYKQNKLRTIQNLKAEAELRVLACVHNPRQALGMINIIEAFDAIKISPLCVFALHLVEITGTASSLLIGHINQQQQSGAALTKTEQDLESITLTFESYAEQNENTRVETNVAVSTYSTIHEDIYTVASEKQASLVLLPFHKHSTIDGVLETTNDAHKEINQNVMKDAPCSVGIFVDRGLGSLYKVNLRVVMLFIGGPDDREALAVAWRVSKHQGIQLTVVRILLLGGAAEVESSPQTESNGLLSTVVDIEKERELDDEYVSSFRLKAVNNEDSITYSEKEIHTRDEITQVLNELDDFKYDLYVLGQGAGKNSPVLAELMTWTDSPELGVIGDMVASNSFGSSCSSVLVVQQYGFGGMVFENTTTQRVNANNDDPEALFVKVE